MSENASTKFFDLHVTGIGYLNRAREVPVRRGEPFLAVDISALHGAADQVEYTRFDCRVSGEEAKKVVKAAMKHLQAERKVLVAFKLGDLYAETFTYGKGEKAGQTGVSLKARLLRIDWVKVDGETVYSAPASSDAPAQPPEDDGEPAPVSGPEDSSADAAEGVADYLPEEVTLARDDPDFEAKKARLKAQGYRFDGPTCTWRLAA